MTLNNQNVIKSLKKINKQKRARQVTTFDFSTLYTKTPHNKLIDVLSKLVDFFFDGGPSKFIAVTKYEAKWVDDPFKYDLVFNKTSSKKAIEFLMNNCHFTIGNKIFQQIIGIPMGSDPAPFFANLFLYYFENKWLRNLQRSNLQKARKFSNTFRFIDDLIAVNDGLEFLIHFKEIYPNELVLSQENENIQEATFLDLNIKIVDKRFTISLYDKRDGFPFNIVRMPYASSNMPSNIFYSSVGAEVLRIARATSLKVDFTRSVEILLERMFSQGATKKRITKTLLKTYGRHPATFIPFYSNALNMANGFVPQ